jgi:hypothetical protein
MNAARRFRSIRREPRAEETRTQKTRGARGTLPRIGLLLFLAMLAGSAGAQVPVKVNRNPEPPFTIQNSPSIALDTASGNLVVAYNDDPWMSPGQGLGASYSPDGGATWIDCPPLPNAWNFWEADPSVVSDQAGFVYAGMSSCDQFAPGQPGSTINSGAVVYVSMDGGRTFPMIFPVSVQTGPAPFTPWETKPKLEVDNFATSPYHRRVYSIWERDLPLPNPQQWRYAEARFSWSPPGGNNWSAPIPVDDGAPFDEVLWPDLAVGPSGDIAAAWLDSPVAVWTPAALTPSAPGQIWFDRSTNGGQSFGRDVPVISFWTVPTQMSDANWQPTRSAMSYASVEVDPSNANHVGIVYAGDPDTGPVPEARVDLGDQPAGASDVFLVNPLYGTSNLASPSGAYVMAAWVDARTSPREVYFNRASSATHAWSSSDLLVSTQASSQKQDAFDASIVSLGGNLVFVIWAQAIAGSATHAIYFNASQRDGEPGSWLASAVPLDQRGRAAWAPVLTHDYLSVCASWIARGADMSRADLCVNYSSNGGATWQPTELIVRGGQLVLSQSMAQRANEAHLVWEEATGGGTASVIYYSRSLSGGAAPWSAPIRLDTAPAGTIAFAPKVCCDGSNVYVTWIDSRNGTYEPYFAYSSASGAPGSWSADIRLNDQVPAGSSRNYYSQIACGSGCVYVVYESDRGALGQPTEQIWINASLNGGSSWIGEQRIDLGDPPSPQAGRHSCHPRLLAGGGSDIPPYVPWVFVAWMDDRNSVTPGTGYDIYGNHSTDGGVTWLPGDYRIDIGDPPGRNNSWLPQIGWAGSPCYLWRDERNGLGDVYSTYFSVGPDEGDVFYIESFDGGQTWGYPPLRVNDDPNTAWVDQSHPWLDFKANGTADVVWYDNRADVANDRMIETYFAALLPGAGAFTANVAVTPPMNPVATWNWTGDYNWIDVDATTAHIALTGSWNDPGTGDVFYVSALNPVLPQPRGACCPPGGSCQFVTEDECLAMGGVYLGEGISCEPDPCEEGIDGPAGGRLRPAVPLECEPNPFGQATAIRFATARLAEIDLSVFDLGGRRLRQLVAGMQPAGEHSVRWDGRDDAGRRLTGGIYFLRLTTPGALESRRVVLMR